MIQVAQLDSSTLALWLDTSSIRHSPNFETYEQVIHAASRADVEAVTRSAMSLESRRGRTRALHLASLVWHEQRHFLDLVVTNYGARRLRHHASIYQNLFALVAGQRLEAESPLVLPIRFHHDPYAEVKGIGSSAVVDQQIRDIEGRIAVERKDAIVLPFGDREVRVGGEQVLEALGFLHQHWSVAHLSAGEMTSMVLEDLPPRLRRNSTYEWPISFLAPLFGDRYEDLGSYPVHPGARLVGAVLVASLMAPYMSASDDTEGVTGRLSRLMVELGEGAGRELRHASFVECWHAVDEIAARTWGRRLTEDLELDVTAEAQKWVEPLGARARAGAETEVADFVGAYHRLRVGLLDRLLRDGPEFLDPTRGPDVENDTPCLPVPISIAARGRNEVPADQVAVFEGRAVISGSAGEREVAWAWGWVPRQWPPLRCIDAVAFAPSTGWRTIAALHAPAAKLMLNGYRHRTMLGPELTQARELLEQFHELEVHTLYQFSPAAGKDLDQLCFLAEKEHLECDVCGRHAAPQDGHIVSASELRSDARSTEAAVSAYARAFGDRSLGEFQMLGDWSPWVTCHTCIDLLAPRRKETAAEVRGLEKTASRLREAARASVEFRPSADLADAYVLQRTGRFEAAVDAYRAITRLGDRETVSAAAFSWGLLSESLRRTEDAHLAYGLAMDPATPAPSAKAAFNDGLLYSREGDPDRALASFRRAAEIGDPDVTAAALCEVGDLQRERGSTDSAAESFAEAFTEVTRLGDADPSDGYATAVRAQELRDQGRHAEALVLFEQVVRTADAGVRLGAAIAGFVCAVEADDEERGTEFAAVILDEGDEETIRRVKRALGLD